MKCSILSFFQDETAPEPECPADMTVTISDSANEATLEYEASCWDNSGESIDAVCSTDSGSTLSLQNNDLKVTCTCTDSSNNQDDCSFVVTVTG